MLGVDLSDGASEIFMATSKGKSIRYKETDVRPMGRNARGVIGIRMAEDDRLVEMEVLSGKPDNLSMTANGGAALGKHKYIVTGVADIDGPVRVASQMAVVEVAVPFVALALERTNVEQGKAGTLRGT